MDINYGSTDEYENLIAEFAIDGKIGIVVSEEVAGEMMISFFVMKNDRHDFSYTKKQEFRTVKASDFIDNLKSAVEIMENGLSKNK